jgi:gamma-glutamyltranspeptidase/glutathione hydrolase
VLSEGGTAADAVVAATIASCVAESVVVGLAGGGFITYFEAATGSVTCLDFFCSVPGVASDREPGPMAPLSITFGGVPRYYAVGGSTVAVPGIPAGLAEIHRRWGRLPWQRLVHPSIGLARTGAVLPHGLADTLATVYPALVLGAGAAIYQPGGRLLGPGDLLRHDELVPALDELASHGHRAFYDGPVGAAIAASVQAAGGVLDLADLADYRVREVPVKTARLGDATIYARVDLLDTIGTIAALPRLLGLAPGPRAVAVAANLQRYASGPSHTSNISVVDSQGNGCALTLTLGLGSGVWVEGYGLHLNSMLGEGELRTTALDQSPYAEFRRGERMSSMMTPLVALDDSGQLLLAGGSAGASRIRSALLHTLINLFVDGMSTADAIAFPRFHPTPAVLHIEPGRHPDERNALKDAGFTLQEWASRHHYFGTVSAIGTAGAGGDPRRSGVGVLL